MYTLNQPGVHQGLNQYAPGTRSLRNFNCYFGYWTLDKWFESSFPKSANLGVKSYLFVNKRVNLNVLALFGVAKCGLKTLGELFGGLGETHFCSNPRIIHLRFCCPQTKSLWNCFYQVFTTFCDFFDSFCAFRDNSVIVDCPKSNG